MTPNKTGRRQTFPCGLHHLIIVVLLITLGILCTHIVLLGQWVTFQTVLLCTIRKVHWFDDGST